MKVEIRERFQANWICHPIIQWDLRAHISFHSTIQSVQTDYESKYEDKCEGTSSNRFAKVFFPLICLYMPQHAKGVELQGLDGYSF